MWSIYAKASRVIVWLVEAKDDSDLTMSAASLLEPAYSLAKPITSPGLLFGSQDQPDPLNSLLKLHGSSDEEHLDPHDSLE